MTSILITDEIIESKWNLRNLHTKHSGDGSWFVCQGGRFHLAH